MNFRTIRKVFDRHKTDKGRDHGYEQMYSELFLGVDVRSLLEIGVREGRSIAAWRELFPEASITGVDIKRPDNLIVNEDIFNYFICDSTTDAIRKVVDTSHDIIIDDGSHVCDDQIATFKKLHDRFNHCYVIEDIYCVGDDRLACERIQEVARQLGHLNTAKYRSVSRYNNTFAVVIFKD